MNGENSFSLDIFKEVDDDSFSFHLSAFIYAKWYVIVPNFVLRQAWSLLWHVLLIKQLIGGTNEIPVPEIK